MLPFFSGQVIIEIRIVKVWPGGLYLRSYGTQEDNLDTIEKVFKSNFWSSY